jgi:hypothetical protein
VRPACHAGHVFKILFHAQYSTITAYRIQPIDKSTQINAHGAARKVDIDVKPETTREAFTEAALTIYDTTCAR